MARLTGGVSTVMVAGRLAPFSDAYEAELRDRGYAPRTIVDQQRQVARLSGWLEAGGLTVAALGGEPSRAVLRRSKRWRHWSFVLASGVDRAVGRAAQAGGG